MMLRISASALLILLTLSMSACGLFSYRDVPYQDSRNQGPLEVPEGLDRPGFDQALSIPEPTPGRDIRDLSRSSSSVSNATGTDAAVQSTHLSDGGLLVSDTQESAWRRIGLALERMSEVEILERDEAQLRYRIEVSASRPTDGWFRRMFRREQLVRETFDLQLEPAVEGARVRASGGGDVAQALLKRLQERLG